MSIIGIATNRKGIATALTMSVLIKRCESPMKKNCRSAIKKAKNCTKTTMVPVCTATPRNRGGDNLERIESADPCIAIRPMKAMGRPIQYWNMPIFQSYGWEGLCSFVSLSKFGTRWARENKLIKLRVKKRPTKTTWIERYHKSECERSRARERGKHDDSMCLPSR